MPNLHIVDPLVWKLLISPRDRTLKEREFIIKANESPLLVTLYETILEENKTLGRKWKKKNLTKYFLIKDPKNRKRTSKRKLLIIFPGRNFNFFQKSNTKYFVRFYETNKLDDHDMALILYPNKVYDIDFLTKSCSMALTQIMQHGYKLENTSFMGWCLGGYIASESIRLYMEQNKITADERFRCYINNKSFARLDQFLYFILPKYIKPILKIWYIKKRIKVWDHDAAESFKKIEPNFESCYVVFSQSDKIVKGFSHLYKHLDDVENKINLREDIECSNHRPNWNLLAELFVEAYAKEEFLENYENDFLFINQEILQ
ncbi:hypothetical protein BpHYR1_025442 [Brachionus plicatilis]|uniref:Thioesterase domain-containing protein n=1 Tax=Brachionus plicatilis TaxID=10195 RepID=A0A3M7P8T5_BRAPC|nr:hypothetical protein BpHYR1_025442 [Brachionus plicatilis]